MRKYLFLAAVAAAAVTSPAYARDNSPYVGVEGGILLPRDTNVDVDALFPVTTDPGIPSGLNHFDEGFDIDYKTGYDVDLIGGYDFGMFRVEGEVAYKHAKINDIEFDEPFLFAINGALDIDPALTNEDINVGGKASVLSGMVNAMLDFGDDAGWSGFVGGGAGIARVKVLGDSDSGFAWQAIAGVRMAISENIDLGLKYRYFRTKTLNFSDDLDFGPDGFVPIDARGKFQSHSLLLSLVYNFAAPPPPPATQTCPDGSVIPATDTCPAPPPPPPPPPPAPERG
jgi:opacity protein-like surface antigen